MDSWPASIVVGVMLVALSVSPANAAQATVQQRMSLSVSVADYIHPGKSNPFKTDAVELGAAAIEGRFALADWRSADRSAHGQVSFYTVCDQWYVGIVSMGRPLTAQNLVGPPQLESSVPSAIASKLVSELAQLEDLHIEYLKPAHVGITC